MKNLDDKCDFYLDEDGNVVFTASYLRERGYCCGNGCKHCPYKQHDELLCGGEVDLNKSLE